MYKKTVNANFVETANETQGPVYAPARWPSDLSQNHTAIRLNDAAYTYEPSRSIAAETIGHVLGHVEIFQHKLGNRTGTNAPASTHIRELIDELTMIADSVDSAELWLEMRREKAKSAVQEQAATTAIKAV